MAQYHYVHDGQQKGPVTLDELKVLMASGTLRPMDMVWAEGTDQWRTAVEVLGGGGVTAGPPPLQYASGFAGGQSYRGMAIAALISALLFAPAGFILGLLALRRMKRSGNPDGRGMAIAGFVIGLIGLIILGLMLLVFVVCLAMLRA